MEALVTFRIVAIVCTGLAAGVFLGHRAGVSFARPHLSPSGFVQLQQLIHVHFKWMMPILVIAATVSSLAWTILLFAHRRGIELWLVALATVAMLCVVVLTRVVNVPINARLVTWSVSAPPADLMELWKPWETVHTIRTVLGIAAFALEVIALGVFGLSVLVVRS